MRVCSQMPASVTTLTFGPSFAAIFNIL